MKTLRFILVALMAVAVIAATRRVTTHQLVTYANAVPLAFALVDIAIAGVIGWLVSRRAPSWTLGPLVLLIGLWISMTLLRVVGIDGGMTGFADGLALAGVALPALVIIGFPDGIAVRRWQLVLGATAVVVTTVAAARLHAAAAVAGTITHPVGSVAMTQNARTALGVQSVVVITLTLAAVIELSRRRRRYRLGRGSTVDPVIVGGAVWTAALIGQRLTYLMTTVTIPLLVPPWVVVTAFSLPLTALGAFIATIGYVLLVRPRLERLPDGRIVLDDLAAGDLAAEVATWVGDPSLEIFYPDGRGDWVDASGHRREPNGPAAGHTRLTRDGEVVALLQHDPALSGATEVLELAAAITGASIEAQAWAATADARVEQSQRLASRLVTADRTTRVHLLATLEAGPLRELEECVELLADGRGFLSDVVDLLKEATAETRRLSHGLYPPELIEGGLSAALDGLTGAPSRRLPTAVEVTAYLLARGDPDATFVDAGTTLEVHLTHSPTDDDTLDRVAVLGGSRTGMVISIPTGGV